MRRRVYMGAKVFGKANVAGEILIFCDRMRDGYAIRSFFRRLVRGRILADSVSQVDDRMQAAGRRDFAVPLRKQKQRKRQAISKNERTPPHENLTLSASTPRRLPPASMKTAYPFRMLFC